MNPVPLLIVMGTILTLLTIQRWLAHADPQNESTRKKTTAQNPATSQTSAASQTPRQQGRKLSKGLFVSGLDERGISSLKALIGKNDIDAITTFLIS